MSQTAQGRFWQVDAQGFIVNDASTSKIPDHYRSALETAVVAYQTNLGDVIHSVYVRGTVSRGMAIPGISDLDTVAVVTSGETTGDLSWASHVSEKITEDCADLTGVGFECWLLRDVTTDNGVQELAFALKTQSVCIYGDDLSDQLSPYKPDALVAAIDLGQIQHDIEEARAALSSATVTDEQARYWCRRIMKNIIRVGFCLTMERERKYTRDLYLCVQTFAPYYPERAGDMRRALVLALNPISNVSELMTFLNTFGGWLIQEADDWLKQHA